MKKRLIAALMALCILAGLLPGSMPAHAESYVVFIVSNLLTAYNAPSTNAKALGIMSYGEAYLCLATNDTWAAIRNSSGAVGYCLKSGLSTEDPNTLSGKVSINTAGVPVYAKPSTASKVMMKLAYGSSYTARAVTADGQWYRLQNGNYYGYVQSQYIAGANQGGSNDNSGGMPDAFTTLVYVQDNASAVYTSPSLNASAKGMMYFGQALICTNTSGNWAKVTGSYSGYCLLDSLTTVNPNNLNYNIAINTAGVPVYAVPSTSGREMMKLAKGSVYKALGITTDGKWYRLQNGSHFGYVPAQYIYDPNKLPDGGGNSGNTGSESQGTTVYIASDTLVAYQKQSTTSGALGTMSFGESYTLLAVDDGWAMIRNADGAVGYCVYGGLTTVNPNSLNDTYYAQNDSVRLYAKPLTSAQVYTSVKTDTTLTVVAISSGKDWMRVKYGNSYAYVRAGDLSTEKVGVVADPNAIQDMNPTPAYVTDDLVVLYQYNSTTSKALSLHAFGESMTITGIGDIWARVETPSGVSGYTKIGGLSTKNPVTNAIGLYVQKSAVYLYQLPGESAKALEALTLNTKVAGLCASSDGTWIRVTTASGNYGYIQSAYLSSSMVNTSTTVTDAIVALAKQQMGKKYVYASEGPDTFDCSGLTYYVYKKAAGVNLKRTAYQQGYDEKYAKITSIAALRVGDLVFFNTSSDSDLCDHVGIYLGGNQFIHASSAGGKVVISSLSSSSNGGYYYKNFSWGRRVL